MSRFVVGLLGLLTVTLLGWHVRKPSNPASPIPVTPGPTVAASTTATISLTDLGLPLYPDATALGQPSALTGDGWRMAQATLATDAPLADVAVWYERQLPGARRSDSAGHDRQTVTFTLTTDSAQATVRLAEQHNQVVILLNLRSESEAATLDP